MPSTQNAVNNHEYRSVPITALAESPTNPRKRFDAKSLEELAASFKTQGILAPLLVRELEESKYEVVAGARRLRAAKLAELKTSRPCGDADLFHGLALGIAEGPVVAAETGDIGALVAAAHGDEQLRLRASSSVSFWGWAWLRSMPISCMTASTSG